MSIVCQQTILMKYHASFVIFEKSSKIWNCRLLQIIGGTLFSVAGRSGTDSATIKSRQVNIKSPSVGVSVKSPCGGVNIKSPTSGLRLGLSRNMKLKPLHPNLKIQNWYMAFDFILFQPFWVPQVEFSMLKFGNTVLSLYKGVFWSIWMDGVISKWCCKEIILQRNYRKMTISYNTIVKFQGKNGIWDSEEVLCCVIKREFFDGIIGKWPFHGHFPIISS